MQQRINKKKTRQKPPMSLVLKHPLVILENRVCVK